MSRHHADKLKGCRTCGASIKRKPLSMRANAVPLDEKNPDGKTRRDVWLRPWTFYLWEQTRPHIQNNWVNNQYRLPDSRIAAGNVSTQAISRLRMVFICKPPPLATMVPATPEDST